MMNKELNEETLQDLYAWVDKIKLSRPKRNISRDFSDGVMAAEVVKHFFPKLVELHNYTPAHSTQQKLINWNTLNRKVFSKLNFHVPADTLRKITLSTPGSIEPVLCALREMLEGKQAGIVSNGKQDLEYYSTANEKAKTENGQSTTENAYMAAGPVNKTQTAKHYRPPAVPGENVDPAFHLLSSEKDQALLASKEIVEILQMKVNRLEQLVHLKDLQIEEQAKKHEHSVKAYKG